MSEPGGLRAEFIDLDAISICLRRSATARRPMPLLGFGLAQTFGKTMSFASLCPQERQKEQAKKAEAVRPPGVSFERHVPLFDVGLARGQVVQTSPEAKLAAEKQKQRCSQRNALGPVGVEIVSCADAGWGQHPSIMVPCRASPSHWLQSGKRAVSCQGLRSPQHLPPRKPARRQTLRSTHLLQPHCDLLCTAARTNC